MHEVIVSVFAVLLLGVAVAVPRRWARSEGRGTPGVWPCGLGLAFRWPSGHQPAASALARALSGR
jgi:hypothetical protein